MLLTGLNDPVQKTDGKYPHDKAKLDYEKIFREIEVICPSMGGTIEYMREIVPARAGESRKCFEEIFNHTVNEESAKRRIFDMNMRTAARNALYFHNKYHIDVEEAFQTCCEGILYAINRYDEGTKASFPNYMWLKMLFFISDRFPIASKRPRKKKEVGCKIDIQKDGINSAEEDIYISQVISSLLEAIPKKTSEIDKAAIACRLARFGLMDGELQPCDILSQYGTDIKEFRRKYNIVRVKLSRLTIKKGILNEIVPSIEERKRIFLLYHRTWR